MLLNCNGQFNYQGLTLIPAWIGDYTHYTKCSITLFIHSQTSASSHPFSCAWDYLSMLGLKLNHVSKQGLRGSGGFNYYDCCILRLEILQAVFLNKFSWVNILIRVKFHRDVLLVSVDNISQHRFSQHYGTLTGLYYERKWKHDLSTSVKF